MNKIRNKKGFSLIELLIVIAIIGILAAIAMPSYSSYVKKSKLAEALSVSAILKTKFLEYYNIQGSIPSTATGLDDMGLSASSIDTKYVTNLSYVQSGIGAYFVITVDDAAIGLSATTNNLAIALKPSGLTVDARCGSTGITNPIDLSNLPSSCLQTSVITWLAS